MATWRATIRFPDGTAQYARYSTVVEAVLPDLYPGSASEREVAGEPVAPDLSKPLSPVDRLTPVTIVVEPDNRTWHAVYDPARRQLLGPYSAFHAAELQARFSLAADDSGVRHLTRERAISRCGRPLPGPLLPFHRPWSLESVESDVPDIDLFAGWSDGSVCRECLALQLPAVS
jgi:hypothetical protein